VFNILFVYYNKLKRNKSYEKSRHDQKNSRKRCKAIFANKQYESLFGRDSHLATAYRNEWMAIYELMKELDIKSDYSLPEWDKAMEIINEMRIIERLEEEDFAKRDIGYSL